VPQLAEVLANGHAFYTCGCPDCNRPYYNDHPGRLLYNYHRPLTPAELTAAFQESGLAQLVQVAPFSASRHLKAAAKEPSANVTAKEAPHA
jgi:biotin synthase-related radical SAM superfamily protein